VTDISHKICIPVGRDSSVGIRTRYDLDGLINTKHINTVLAERTPPTAHSNRFQLFHDSGR
jgi:hypothetical protein